MTPSHSLFLTVSELEGAFIWLAANDSLFQYAPAFGVAGGPDIVTLSDAGRLVSYDVAAVYRFRIGLPHIFVLEQLAAVGDTGIPITSFSRENYGAARELDVMLNSAQLQSSLAASLRGDHSEYVRMQDRGRLVYVDHSVQSVPVYRLTSLGQDYVSSARKVSKALIAARNQRDEPSEEEEACDGDEDSAMAHPHSM